MSAVALYAAVLDAHTLLHLQRARIEDRHGADVSVVTAGRVAKLLDLQAAYDLAVAQSTDYALRACRELDVTRARGNAALPLAALAGRIGLSLTPPAAQAATPEQAAAPAAPAEAAPAELDITLDVGPELPPIEPYSPGAVWDNVAAHQAQVDMLNQWRAQAVVGPVAHAYRRVAEYCTRSDQMAAEVQAVVTQLEMHRAYLLTRLALPPHDAPSDVDPSTWPLVYARNADAPAGVLLRLLADEAEEARIPPHVTACLVLYVNRRGERECVRVDLDETTHWQALQDALAHSSAGGAQELRFACRYAHISVRRHADGVLATLRAHGLLDDSRAPFELLAWHYSDEQLPLLIEIGPERYLLRESIASASVASLLQWLGMRGRLAGLRYENDPTDMANSELATHEQAGQLAVASPALRVFEPYASAPGTVPYLTLVPGVGWLEAVQYAEDVQMRGVDDDPALFAFDAFGT